MFLTLTQWLITIIILIIGIVYHHCIIFIVGNKAEYYREPQILKFEVAIFVYTLGIAILSLSVTSPPIRVYSVLDFPIKIFVVGILNILLLQFFYILGNKVRNCFDKFEGDMLYTLKLSLWALTYFVSVKTVVELFLQI